MELLTPQPGHSPKIHKTFKRLFWPTVISLVFVLMASLFFIAYAFSARQDTIPNNTYVGDVYLGGLTSQQAERRLLEKLPPLANEKVTLSCQSVTQSQSFAELGAQYEIQKMVSAAMSQSSGLNVISRTGSFIASMFNKRVINPEISCAQDKASAFVDNFANEADDPVADEQYKIEGSRLKITQAVKGSVIDRQNAQGLVVNVVKTGKSTKIELEKSPKEPKLLSVDELYNKVATPPVDAKLEVRNGKSYLIPHKDGISFDKAEAQKIIDRNRGSGKPFYIPLIVTPAKIKSRDLEGGLFADVLSKYDSKLTNKEANRLNNVRLAASKINGIILQPDEEFSYNDAIGATTAANGYKKAAVYLSGKVEQGMGGGVCQVSSTLYASLLHTDLKVTKRFNHSMIVTYVPFGMDATVSNSQIDLRFVNNTNAPLKITASVDSNYVHVALLGTKTDKTLQIDVENKTISHTEPQVIKNPDPSLPLGQEKIDQNGMAGYVIDTYKIYKRGGVEIRREYVGRSTYNVLDRIIRVGSGAKAAAPEQHAEQPPTPEQPESAPEVQQPAEKPPSQQPPAQQPTAEPKPTAEPSETPQASEPSQQPETTPLD